MKFDLEKMLEEMETRHDYEVLQGFEKELREMRKSYMKHQKAEVLFEEILRKDEKNSA